MKVAIVHYWLVGMRGGERVLEALCALYPDAVIVTHVVDRSRISQRLLKHDIRETFVARLPFARRLYQKYLPLMPLALEQMDMTEFDLVISSEAGPAKGVIVRPDALHLCYCHSPMRYVWDQYHVYRGRAGLVKRMLMPFIAHYLRQWDVTSASRVDHFIANSRFVAQRIEKYYRRGASILHPPVAVEDFSPVPAHEVQEHYLFAGELVSYKRADLAVAAFTKSGRKLRVVGDGPERAALERMAGPNVEFIGRLGAGELSREFAQCRALVFPGVEDFGIIPVEVMAAGRPVIAFGRGGALDSVVQGTTGLFFSEQSVAALAEAVDRFESEMLPSLDTEAIRVHAESFSNDAFAQKWGALVAASRVEA